MIDFATLASLIAVMVSIGTFVLAWRKAPHENRNIGADTDAKITAAAVLLVEPLKKRIDELEAARERDKARMAILEQRITDLECELREERNLKAEITDGANKLAHQVESLGGQPVYRPPKRGTGELKAKT